MVPVTENTLERRVERMVKPFERLLSSLMARMVR